jgi:hypothetical protein
VRRGELDVDVLPEIVHLESLLVIRHDGAHDVLIPVFLLAEELSDVVGAFAVQDIAENSPRLVRKAVIDEDQVHFPVLHPHARHRARRFPLIQ